MVGLLVGGEWSLIIFILVLTGFTHLWNVLFTEVPTLTQGPKTIKSKMLTSPQKDCSFEKSTCTIVQTVLKA